MEPGADEIVSYVCGTLTTAAALTHDSMSKHELEGTTLCIHSVVTEGGHRRKHIGTRTLRAYMQWVGRAALTPGECQVGYMDRNGCH